MPNQRSADTRHLGKARTHLREEVREGEKGEKGGTEAEEDPREREKVERKDEKESPQNRGT